MERMQDETAGGGYGAVHTHLSAGGAGEPGQQAGGEGGGATAKVQEAASQAKDRAQEVADQAKDRAQEVAGQAKDRAQEVVGQVKERAQELGGRASEVVGRAREKLSSSGVLGRIQENPLPALGIAFGLGFLLAGSDEQKGRRGGMAHKAKNQLKGAIMGGLSAAVAQEFRSMVGLGGQGGGLLASLQGAGGGDDDGEQPSGTAGRAAPPASRSGQGY